MEGSDGVVIIVVHCRFRYRRLRSGGGRGRRRRCRGRQGRRLIGKRKMFVVDDGSDSGGVCRS